MRKLLIVLAAAAAAAFAFPTVGCQHLVSGNLDPEKIEGCVEAPATCEVKAETVAFAIIADYSRAKDAAVRFAAQPSTSLEEVDFIIQYTGEIDAEIAAFVTDVNANAATEDDYLRISRVVRNAVLRLTSRLASHGLELSGGPEPNLVQLLRSR